MYINVWSCRDKEVDRVPENLDFKNYFSQVTGLSFNHCDMSDFKSLGDPNSDQEYDRRQAFLAMAREAFERVENMSKVETVSILSNCSPIHLKMLLSHCPRVKQVILRKWKRDGLATLWFVNWLPTRLS